MKNAPSPLLVWKLLVVVLLIALAAMLFVDPKKAEVTRRKKAVSSKLDGIHFQPEELSILFFGNSLLRQSLTGESELARAFNDHYRRSHQSHKPVRVVNLTFGGASPQYLRTVADQIIALRPTAIVIQIDMIIGRTMDPEEFVQHEQAEEQVDTVSWRFQYWSNVLRQPMMKYFPGSLEPSPRSRRLLNPLSSPVQIDIPFLRKDKRIANPRQALALVAAKSMWSDQTVSTQDPRYRICRSFIRKAIAEGIKVIVVQPPVGVTANHLVQEGYFEKRIAAVRAITKPKLRKPLRFPRVLPDDCFKDYSHANEKGQRLFLRWFIPALALEIEAQT